MKQDSGIPTIERSKVLIVDDHPLLRRGMAAILAQQPDFEVCAEAANSQLGLQAMREHQPDIALVDISLPGTNGLELIKLMLAEQPKLRGPGCLDARGIALRPACAEGRRERLPDEGRGDRTDRHGCKKKLPPAISTSPPHFSEQLVFKAIRSLEGGMGSPVDRLSDRELEVLRLLGKGLGTRDIARALHLSVKTIETHRAPYQGKARLQGSGRDGPLRHRLGRAGGDGFRLDPYLMERPPLAVAEILTELRLMDGINGMIFG